MRLTCCSSVGSEDRDQFYHPHRPSLQRQPSLKPLESIFVKTVKEGSPAELSGLHPGDRLVAINGDSITGKPYPQVIETIHSCDSVLKLLVVPKDEDILQMAYPIQSENSFLTDTNSVSDTRGYPKLKEHQQFHSQSNLNTNAGSQAQKELRNCDAFMEQHDVRYSFPLSGMESQEIDYRLGSSSESQPFRVGSNQQHIQKGLSSDSCTEVQMSSQEPNFATTYNIPSKSKYSFGLYFPPKVSAPSSSKNSNPHISGSRAGGTEISRPAASGVRRKSSLDETSVLSASAKSRDYFIRYSTEKAASDNRNRYSPRHSAYERYTSESHPETYISRSQTISNISPTKPLVQPVSQTTMQISSGPSRHIPVLTEAKPSNSSDHKLSSQCVVRIPYEQQQPSPMTGNQPQAVTLPLVRQNYGTTFALTRSPTATHIEISKSIGKPIVSQRKYQFEIAAASEQTSTSAAAPNNGGPNRYKTEIEKIRTQPKFSSIAMRKASFEQSPDRDPPGFDDPEEACQSKSEFQDYQPSKMETAQPTIKGCQAFMDNTAPFSAAAVVTL
ncbi:Na(+)/H(+) exchange regulatory cofactor NHE-RF1 [Elysia marginata]|uniref:Na(+)/H(+) exchange regulatory cofactor NHE-RF1 n=1 Tax=Elysia marginata TaxID=1093978 RepID=A0AAV4HZG0_9GAST|nr:Na(+)/H(+) exchange regulatory cofactor NHE-RF1 [Elysia marginata]